MPITSQHKDYTAHRPEWDLCRHLVAGERVVKEQGEKYLYRLSEQNDNEYKSYKGRAVLLGAFARTIDGLCGMVERKAAESELSPQIEALAEDIDLSGRSLDDFAGDIVRDVLITGRGGILVEYPAVRLEGATVGDTEAAGVRPYLVYYTAEAVVDWRAKRQAGKQLVTWIKLRETVEEPDPKDPWTLKAVEQYRVLTIEEGAYEQVLYRKQGDAWSEYARIRPLKGGAALDEIPWQFIGGVETQKPPLLDLATLNIAHYRNSADYENGLHFSGVPTPIFIGNFTTSDQAGAPVTKIALGSSTGIQMSEGSDAKFLEYNGAGIEGGLGKAMETKVADMAKLGARMLEESKRAAEAAETAMIHRQSENSILAALAKSVSRSIMRALDYMASWLGEEAENSYWLNTDYVPASMSAQDITALVGAWIKGALSTPELFAALKAGEVVRDDKKLDEHTVEVEADNEAREAKAEADAERSLAAMAGRFAVK